MIQRFSTTVSLNTHTIEPTYVPIELNIKNQKTVALYQESLTALHAPTLISNVISHETLLRSAQRIDQIQSSLVSVTCNLVNNKIYKGLQWWTPQTMANKAHLKFIMTLHRWSLHGKHQRIIAQLPSLVQRLKLYISKLNRTDDPNATVTITLDDLTMDGFTIDHWTSINPHQYQFNSLLLYQKSKLKLKLKNRFRYEQYIAIGKFRKDNERKRENRDFKILFRRLFNHGRTNIEEIRNADASLCTDSIMIHEHLTKQLETHHSLNLQSNQIDWITLLDHPADIHNVPEFHIIPNHLKEAFSQAFAKHRNTPLHDTMSKALNEPITFYIFKKAINYKKTSTSPGLSGATINMLRSTPDPILHELYEHLNFLWTNRTFSKGRVTPQSWCHRWMAPIPKDESDPSNLEKIRPISLYEVTRKVWTSIINRRICAVWEKLNSLHGSQYGYRFNSGTDTALLQLINLIEDADEYNKTLILTAFDTKKAFDSVNKSLMQAAWIRLGIPPDIAEYLTFLDNTGSTLGKTVVKSPHAVKMYHKYGLQAVLSDESSAQQASSFIAQHGIGQGDSISATAWTALFDILLSMLDTNTLSPYNYQVSPQEVATCQTVAYADDLNTISPTVQHAQVTVDLVSAFNCITGFSFNNKLECGTNSANYVGQKLIFHDNDWQPFELEISHSTPIKILGIPIDLRNGWTQLEAEVKNRMSKVTINLASRNVSTLTKATAFQMVIVPAVLYAAKFLNRTVKELEKLFLPIGTFLRKCLKLSKTFPTQLLYLKSKKGGLHLPSITNQIQKLKHNMLKRALNSNFTVSFSVQAMLARCYRQSITDPIEPLQHSDFHKSWIASYIEFQSMNNFALFFKPIDETDPQVNSITIKGNRDFIDWRAAQLEVDTLRDLLYPRDQHSMLTNSEYEVNYLHPLVPFLQIPNPLPKLCKH